MKRYKLVNKSRFYAFIFSLISIITLGILLLSIQNVQGEMKEKYDIIIVDSGDTIWKIAQQHNNNKYKDLRQYVYEIKKVNNLLGDMLKPNQKLRIPKTL